MKQSLTPEEEARFFGAGSIWKVLLRTAPPVMLSQLVLSLYNIVDSLFVGRFSLDGLTALSVIYPIQLIITAFSVGTGVGVDTYMAKLYATGESKRAKSVAGTGMVLAVFTWIIFASCSALTMRPYVNLMINSEIGRDYAYQYGMIVCIGSLGTFLEGTWTKIHQSHGNMVIPMIAQLAGAITNIVLDWIFIFGLGSLEPMGVMGAAIATVIGQFVSAIIVGIHGFHLPPKFKELIQNVGSIYRYGISSIIMQLMYTIYIVALNAVLSGFCDEAVTVLGLYYKLQSFFFIPLFGLQTAIIPVLSYNYTQKLYKRTKRILWDALIISASFMAIGIICFEFFPKTFIGIFSKDATVLSIGEIAFRIIGASFFPAAFSLLLPVFFQAIGKNTESIILSIVRQIVCLIPIFYGFSFLGLNYTWISFPISETVTTIIGLILVFKQFSLWKKEELNLQN